MIKPFESEKGVGLVEVIFSLAIAIVIVTSLVSLSLFTLRTSIQNKLMMRASDLVNQQIELVRAKRDSNSWSDFTDSVGSCAVKCSIDTSLNVTLDSAVSGAGADAITYYFTAVAEGEQIVKINAVGTWSVGGQAKTVHNYTELSDWRSL